VQAVDGMPAPINARFKFLSRKLTSARSEEQEQAAGEADVNSELQRYHAAAEILI